MENSVNSRKKTNLTNEQRQSIYQMLLQQSVDGGLKSETTRDAATLFSVSTRTISRIWHDVKLQLQHGTVVDVSSKRANVIRRKRVQIDFAGISQIPLRRRTTIRSLAKAINVSKTTMHRRIKEGALKAHTNAIKPDLTDENKKTRLVFCLSSVTRSLSNGSPVFHDMFNVIHIDEKWFYLSKPSKGYYLVPDEDEPYRTCKSKKFITKVMFLAAVARPRYDSSGNEVFSGKIGIFPFTTLEPAKRSRNHTGPIYIQQDNAKPHIEVNDAEFKLEASKDGFDIRLCFQPPNSPDLNVLNLGFFRAIQSLQEQEVLGSIDELVSAVKSSFERMPSHELNKVFLTLQTCMKEIMKVQGGNNYKIPHIGKGKLERQGNLPLQIECDENLIYEALSYLSQ
ncbi:uncharacterized protein LOC110944677 [Helianthus annuus]|uniref:uncharacterized protein LOC110944677 n=1 Tax=Helianthus annuus TaxID=4232 RepID=UPI000B8EED4A|nr:uncharacterized protein LOC110944677 [Helianthus annuus]